MGDLSFYSRAEAEREHEEELAGETVRELLPAQFDKTIVEFLDSALADARFDAAAHHPTVTMCDILGLADAETELLAWLQARADARR